MTEHTPVAGSFLKLTEYVFDDISAENHLVFLPRNK